MAITTFPNSLITSMITELLCSFWSGKSWINSRYNEAKFRVYMVNIGFSLIAKLTVIFNAVINHSNIIWLLLLLN